MVKTSSLANAVTIVATAAYLLCGILAYAAPDIFWTFGESWLHAINLEALKATTTMPIGTFIIGIVSFAVYIWIATFVAGKLYNRLSAK